MQAPKSSLKLTCRASLLVSLSLFSCLLTFCFAEVVHIGLDLESRSLGAYKIVRNRESRVSFFNAEVTLEESLLIITTRDSCVPADNSPCRISLIHRLEQLPRVVVAINGRKPQDLRALFLQLSFVVALQVDML